MISHIGVMVWPDVYNEENLELFYNMSEKSSLDRMAQCLRDFLIRKDQIHSQMKETSKPIVEDSRLFNLNLQAFYSFI